MKKTEQIIIRMNQEEKTELITMSYIFTNGNTSEYIRQKIKEEYKNELLKQSKNTAEKIDTYTKQKINDHKKPSKREINKILNERPKTEKQENKEIKEKNTIPETPDTISKKELKEEIIKLINEHGTQSQKNKIKKIEHIKISHPEEVKIKLEKAKKNPSNNAINNLIFYILKGS